MISYKINIEKFTRFQKWSIKKHNEKSSAHQSKKKLQKVIISKNKFNKSSVRATWKTTGKFYWGTFKKL